jgi:hypothetical protein
MGQPSIKNDFTRICEPVPAAASNTPQVDSKLFGEEAAKS